MARRGGGRQSGPAGRGADRGPEASSEDRKASGPGIGRIVDLKASGPAIGRIADGKAQMGKSGISVQALRKSFGAKEAVAGVDLDIAAGSLAGLVGPNGAGKTTSLSMMTGLLRPDSGRVLIDGLDVWADPPAAKAIIGVVPAEARLFERLSGEELLEYAGRLRGLPAAQARERAAQLLAVLDLTADARRLVADYSTGMRKKAMLGCALIHNPSVLFLDEPLEGVDPVSADVIRRLTDPLRRLRVDRAVLQPRHGTGRAGLRSRLDHRQGPDRGHRHDRRGPRRPEPAAGVHRPGRGQGQRRGGPDMAWLLVQLKLRLLRNALRASTGAKAAFITSTILAALVAAGVFIVLARLRGHPDAVDLTTVIFTVFAFGWLIVPLLVFGLDGTLDPATLALFPLRTRPLAVGLLAASATGAWPLATLLGLLGVTVGLARGRPACSSRCSRCCCRCCSASRWRGSSPRPWPGCCARAAARTSPPC